MITVVVTFVTDKLSNQEKRLLQPLGSSFKFFLYLKFRVLRLPCAHCISCATARETPLIVVAAMVCLFLLASEIAMKGTIPELN